METVTTKIVKPINQTFSLPVVKVIKETEEATSIYFDISGKEDAFKYQSGQHIILHFKLGGKKVSRAYSLFTAPHEDDFAITVKRVKGGLVSNYLNDTVKAGDTIEVSPPRGVFGIKGSCRKAKTYYFFGGGSGITPLLSSIKSILKNEPLSDIFFLYGNRNKESIIHHRVLDGLQKKYAGRLQITHELESEGGFFGKGLLSNLLQAKTGWIDKRRVLYFLKDNPTDLPAEYFICGPSGMMNNVEDALTDVGVEPSKIHLERFGSNPQEALNNSDLKVQTAELTYTLEGIRKRIQIRGNKTLFESLTQVGEDIPHSCLAGSCASCACTIKKGSVKMKECYALNETQLNDNFILACQAIPQTKTIEIDFDII
ncbi:MAG: ferredoxin--NADP reductase [Bacteroidota bacterium]